MSDQDELNYEAQLDASMEIQTLHQQIAEITKERDEALDLVQELELEYVRGGRKMFCAIREHCIYAMFAMIDPASPIDRAMNMAAFRARAKDRYTGAEYPSKVYNNEFHAKVECLMQAIWETLKGGGNEE